MEKEKLNELIARYNNGLASSAEITLIASMIEEGNIDLTELHVLNALNDELMKTETPAPSINLDDQFYAMLSAEKKKIKVGGFSFSFQWNALFPQVAYGLLIMVIGFAGGYFLNRPGQNKEVHELTQQVSDLKEMMMLSLLEKESATDRLKAVNLTSEMKNVSEKVTDALFKTLNQDENVNVRLAALEALKAYVRDSKVREGLVQSISKQKSPLVQVALAELMVSIQEKESVKELQKILENKKTPAEIKDKIKESLNVLS